jgi:hypothetical protein
MMSGDFQLWCHPNSIMANLPLLESFGKLKKLNQGQGWISKPIWVIHAHSPTTDMMP